MQMQMQASPVLSLSPSFNTYSSDRLAEIAARVVEEFRQDSGSCDQEEEVYQTGWPQQNQQQVIQEDDDDDDLDFEFAFVCKEPEASTISADEIFYNGQIRPIYPLFNTNLTKGNPDGKNVESGRTRRPELRKLMSEERETSSCSSSEADELDRAASGTYCVWAPKKGSVLEESSGRSNKSNSTGNSSKRWKLRQLLYRSSSDGKDTFVFLAPSKRDKTSNSDEVAGNFKLKEADQEDLKRTGEKRRPYLPYRQDLVGLFSNVNGLSRNLHPF